MLAHVSAQDAVPKPKTKAERKAERKNMTLEEKIESALPVDVSLPSASAHLPGGKNVSTVEDAKKYMSEMRPGGSEKAKELKEKIKKSKKALADVKKNKFDGKNYEGLAVEKRIYKRGTGSRLQYIEFYTLKNYQAPSPYSRSLFWYDERTRRIVEALTRDTKTNHLLHGPYKEYRGETLVKSGYYYQGTLHERWETYDTDFILLDKVSYDKGFLADAEISYYDEANTKVNEVIPMLYGKKTGEYWKFYPSGTLETKGQYDNGVKVGQWLDFYDGGNRRKKEMMYPKDCFDDTEMKVLREYAEDGKLTFEHDSVKKQ